jgi:hypothetical protein
VTDNQSRRIGGLFFIFRYFRFMRCGARRDGDLVLKKS